MQDINEYILKPKEERQSHLKLDEPCIEIGGNSTAFRGLLAHTLKTTIPKGGKINLCHACHNEKCSNPNHLYWGTAGENRVDFYSNGGKTIWDNLVLKHGEEGARELNRRPSDTARRSARFGKGVPKTEEHKKKISESIKKKNNALVMKR